MPSLRSAARQLTNSKTYKTPKGDAGYDNPRENIDPHIKTKVVNTREGTVEKIPVNSKDIVNKIYVDDNFGPSGSVNEVQYYDNGNFRGDAGMVYFKAIARLELLGGFLATGAADLGDGSFLRTSAAPSTDKEIANKKYVDDSTHTKYLDNEAVAAVLADDAYLKNTGDTATGTININVPTTTQEGIVLTTTDDNSTKNLFEVRDSAGVLINKIQSDGIVKLNIPGLLVHALVVHESFLVIGGTDFAQFQMWTDGQASEAINYGFQVPGSPIGVDLVFSTWNGSFWREGFRVIHNNKVKIPLSLEVAGNITGSNLIVGGTGHDGFSDFVANEHIDWTSTSNNFSTSGNASIGNASITGGLKLSLVSKTANYTATSSDHTIICGAGNESFTVTLPAAAGVSGIIYNIKNIGTGTITVDGASTETIDGSTTAVLNTQYDSITIQCDGTEWWII